VVPKRSLLHAIQKEYSSRGVPGRDHGCSVGRRWGRRWWWRRGGWRRRCQRFQRNEWNRSGQPGRNESRLRGDQSANDAWFGRQPSTGLHRRIERNDERKRAEQHSNSDRIERDKFDGRHRMLRSCFYHDETAAWPRECAGQEIISSDETAHTREVDKAGVRRHRRWQSPGNRTTRARTPLRPIGR
jgi:hypothetical protein